MGIFYSLVKKEVLHIFRDTRTLIIAVVMPLVLLLLFGFAISTEVNKIRVVAIVETHNDETARILQRIKVNPYFTFSGLADVRDLDVKMKKGEIDAAVVLRETAGQIVPQIIADASNPVISQASTMYIQRVISDTEVDSHVAVRTLYNPQMKSAYNFVPGILGMIFILICSIITSVSIVSEKESGTMNLLLVSPIRPRTIIFGKLIPYFMLSCIILSLMLTMSYTILELPFTTGFIWVIGVSLLYIALSLSIGLLVSTLVNTQVAALIISALLFMLPVIMLSGMIFPIDNMPLPLQNVSRIIPARWYISAMRKLMIQQLSVGYIIKEIAILSGMTVTILLLAITKFNKKR